MDVLVISALFGLAAPYVISFLKGSTWSRKVKIALSIVVSIAGAFLALAVDGQLGAITLDEVIANSALIFAAAQVYYQTYFGGTPLETRLENVKVLGK